MKIILFLEAILFFILFACSGVNHIDYKPDISNVQNPISTIKTTLEQQPPAYAYVPVKVEVTDEKITLFMEESGKLSMITGASSIVPMILYYKNLGEPKLSKSNNSSIWIVEIYDTLGNDLYWVYTQNEEEAKNFFNALYLMINAKKR
jgi:hypothetical protein